MELNNNINNLITIVIPTKDEEQGIGMVIDELYRYGFSNILVVDGYSKDNTVSIAKSKGVKVIYQKGKGKTGALLTAIEYVDTPYIAVIDGDYTYDPSKISDMLRLADRYGEVIGARVPISKESMTMLHRFGNKVLTSTFNLLMGTKISDLCSGLYILKKDIADRLKFNGSGFDVEAEIAAQVAAIDKIAEVKINYRPRLGKQKLSTWRHGFGILKSIIMLANRYNPNRFYAALSLLIAIPALLAALQPTTELIIMNTIKEGMPMVFASLALQAMAGVLLTLARKRSKQ